MAEESIGREVAATTLDAYWDGQFYLTQPKSGYRAGLDAMLLASTVMGTALDTGTQLKPHRILDLGAGVGAVGLGLAIRHPSAHATLLEIEPQMAGHARANIERNCLTPRATVILGDATAPPKDLIPNSFDLVVLNPPYQVEGQGHAAKGAARARAHAMAEGALAAWLKTASQLCRAGGHIHIIHRADALGEILQALDRRFGAVHILPVTPTPGAPAMRVIVGAKKGSRAPLKLLSPLVIHDLAGGFEPKVSALLRGQMSLVLDHPSLFLPRATISPPQS